MKQTPSIPRVRSSAPISSTKHFPFASEFVTDAKGRISKVMISLHDYQNLLESLEDEGMYRAIRQVRHERPLSISAARKQLARE